MTKLSKLVLYIVIGVISLFLIVYMLVTASYYGSKPSKAVKPAKALIYVELVK